MKCNDGKITVNYKNYLVGIFDDEHGLISALVELQEQKIPVYDVYTPFPVHGLDDIMGIKRSRLPFVTAVAGGCGLAFALFFQYWTSVADWPINVGGKPFHSFPAFIPVAFEITVLLGALCTVAAFLFRAKLCPSACPEIIDRRATDDKFVIAIEKKNSSVDEEKLRNIFKKCHASEVHLKEVEQCSC